MVSRLAHLLLARSPPPRSDVRAQSAASKARRSWWTDRLPRWRSFVPRQPQSDRGRPLPRRPLSTLPWLPIDLSTRGRTALPRRRVHPHWHLHSPETRSGDADQSGERIRVGSQGNVSGEQGLAVQSGHLVGKLAQASCEIARIAALQHRHIARQRVLQKAIVAGGKRFAQGAKPPAEDGHQATNLLA